MYFKNTPPELRKRKESFSFANFGFPTILLTFVMMSIMTFGVLALITANSDLKLSKKVAEKTTGYYEAEEKSYSKLQELDLILQNIYQSAPTEDNFHTILLDHLSTTTLGDVNFDEKTRQVRIHWEIPFSDMQYLSVTVRVHSTNEISNGFYTIEEWTNNHYDNSDEVDDSLHLIGSDDNDSTNK